MPRSKLALLTVIIFCISMQPRVEPSLKAFGTGAAFDLAVSPGSDPDPRNETTIAVSPVDDRMIVGASKVITGGGTSPNGTSRVAYYFSSDGGRTWGSGLLGLATPQKTWGRATDPAVAVDLNGTFYLSTLMLDNSSQDSSVYVFKSTDGGRTFTDPVPAVFDIGNTANPKRADKSYITVDTSPNSQFKNTVYAIWTSTDTGPNGFGRTVIFISRKRPGGTAFSEPKSVSHEGDMRGPSITTGPNGELYAAWQGMGNPRVILFNASTDGGETFLPFSVAPSVDTKIHNYVGSLTPPNESLLISAVPRMNSFPVIDVDRSTGPSRGIVYVAWAETTNRIDADIFVKRFNPPNGQLPDLGPPVKVNNDPVGADQFFPWLSVDASDGAVEVAFYDRRENPGGLPVNMFVARSTDAGLTFHNNTKVSGDVSNPRLQADVTALPFNSPIGIGDYVGLAAARGKAHLLWADTRRGKQEIFYGQVRFSETGGGDPPSNDICLFAVNISSLPYLDNRDTRQATSSTDDPVSCTGSRDTNSTWYRFTPAVDTVYGIETFSSDYDTVLSVYTGDCGAFTRVACNDDFGSAAGPGTRSLLTLAARAGVTYLIETSGKGSGGTLRLRLGAPTITNVEYTTAPDESTALKITGAGFVDGNVRVTVRTEEAETLLPTIIFAGDRQGDNTQTMIFATKKRLKKLVKKGRLVTVSVESPIGSNIVSVPYSFTRQ